MHYVICFSKYLSIKIIKISSFCFFLLLITKSVHNIIICIIIQLKHANNRFTYFQGLKGLDAFEIINSPQHLRHQLDYHVTTRVTSSSNEPMRVLRTRVGAKPVYETDYYDFDGKRKAVSVQCTRQLVARQPENNRMTSCAGNIVPVEQVR